ncbi:MAG: HAMP domain-containing histidine kinase [Alphaproteobacteria bacterium]|nr:HAMP domain-containing histidine kinase [Alphaproteobacteria bacterium]
MSGTGSDAPARAPEAVRSPGLLRGLSGRLIVLSALFVMLAEVLIYVPSIARFRHTYLVDQLKDGRLALLAADVAPTIAVADQVASRLLDVTGAQIISLRRDEDEGPGARHVIMRAQPKSVDLTIDLGDDMAWTLMLNVAEAFMAGGDRVLRVIGRLPDDPKATIEVVIDEAPLHQAMLAYSWRILGLSLVIAAITGVLLVVSLHWLMVRPLQRLTASMTAFGARPEDPRSVVVASSRADEIGVAERELARMQAELRASLVQKTRLASIGTAVAKFNHDLRNILATALLSADQLAQFPDEAVRRRAGRLAGAIDRAVSLCAQSLKFARDGAPEIALEPTGVGAVVDAVGPALPGGGDGWTNAVPAGLQALADSDQLYRVLANLGRNAFEAGARTVTVRASVAAEGIVLEVADDGPGLAEPARATLFQPFAGTAKPGGTGLGLAIARDLMRAQGGDVALAWTGPDGTCFRLLLPHP